MINGMVYTIFLKRRGRARLESLGMSSFKSLPAQGRLSLEESPQRRRRLVETLSPFLDRSAMLAVRCVCAGINTHSRWREHLNINTRASH